MEKIKIIKNPTPEYPFVIINKPKGLASAPLNAHDKENALYQAAEIFPQIYNVHGKKEIEYGLVHRIDTVTDGLLLIATTQDSYDKLIKLQEEGKFIKYYTATCKINKNNGNQLTGFPLFEQNYTLKIGEKIKVSSYFRSFGKGHKEVRPVTEKSNPAALKKLGKLTLYETEITIQEINEDSVKVECKISKGYRHQVRCHLAWIGLPIDGDPLYNFNFINSEKSDGQKKIAFTATKLEIPGTRFELA
ncbi:MAG: RNA pseudouridine synthase [Treponema sp.]|nr:RNA pseudouridine synthase [Treponema sp.]